MCLDFTKKTANKQHKRRVFLANAAMVFVVVVSFVEAAVLLEALL